MNHPAHHPITVAGEAVELLAERAVWWPAAATLLVADLHWGKSETFHHAGVPIPRGVLADDLERLGRIVERCGATRLTVLGDLIHGRVGIDATVIGQVADWRALRPELTIELVPGNHDRHLLALPPSWEIEVLDAEVRRGPFCLRHAPTTSPSPTDGPFTWAGHLHPTVRLRGGGDALRLPCFHLTDRVGVLPAFSAFTGGVVVQRRVGDRVFAVAEGRVVAI